MNLNILITFCLFLLNSASLMANGADDFFRSTGKIYTVLAVVLILFFVIVYFLVRLESKINKLDKQIKDGY